MCWKWIFSVEENRNKQLPKLTSPPRGPSAPGGLGGGGRSVLTVSRGMDDQELLVLQRGHSVCQLGHLRVWGKRTGLAAGYG